jgi:hypothetical protein
MQQTILRRGSRPKTGMDALGTMLKMPFKMLSIARKAQTMTVAVTMMANHMAYQQFPSEAAMYEAQEYFGAPTTMLNSGEGIRSILTKGDKHLLADG